MDNQSQTHDEVIIFTRYPEPGKVKTRLIPHLGKEKAAQVHRQLTEHTLQSTRPIEQKRLVRFSLFFTGGSLEKMVQWLGDTIFISQQKGKNIGRKMALALKSAWERGADRAVLIGSDCPSIDAELLNEAFESLHENDIILGPTYDGGYYLIGLNKKLPDGTLDLLFQDISWGTSNVLQQTLQKAEGKNLSISLLKMLHDIDRPEDLEHFNHYTNPQ